MGVRIGQPPQETDRRLGMLSLLVERDAADDAQQRVENEPVAAIVDGRAGRRLLIDGAIGLGDREIDIPEEADPRDHLLQAALVAVARVAGHAEEADLVVVEQLAVADHRIHHGPCRRGRRRAHEAQDDVAARHRVE